MATMEAALLLFQFLLFLLLLRKETLRFCRFRFGCSSRTGGRTLFLAEFLTNHFRLGSVAAFPYCILVKFGIVSRCHLSKRFLHILRLLPLYNRYFLVRPCGVKTLSTAQMSDSCDAASKRESKISKETTVSLPAFEDKVRHVSAILIERESTAKMAAARGRSS